MFIVPRFKCILFNRETQNTPLTKEKKRGGIANSLLISI